MLFVFKFDINYICICASLLWLIIHKMLFTINTKRIIYNRYGNRIDITFSVCPAQDIIQSTRESNSIVVKQYMLL